MKGSPSKVCGFSKLLRRHSKVVLGVNIGVFSFKSWEFMGFLFIGRRISSRGTFWLGLDLIGHKWSYINHKI